MPPRREMERGEKSIERKKYIYRHKESSNKVKYTVSIAESEKNIYGN